MNWEFDGITNLFIDEKEPIYIVSEKSKPAFYEIMESAQAIFKSLG